MTTAKIPAQSLYRRGLNWGTALTAASTFGITWDCENCFVNRTNLADQIEASGRTWRAYLESTPSPCDLTDSGTYGMWHNPWLYYSDIRTNTARCNADVVPYTYFATDLASSNPPNFMWVTPNLCDDVHRRPGRPSRCQRGPLYYVTRARCVCYPGSRDPSRKRGNTRMNNVVSGWRSAAW